MFCKAVSFFLIFSLVSAGCATKQAGIVSQHAVMQSQEILVKRIEYDAEGLPVFSHRLGERPSRTGDQFTVVQLIKGKPATSFDIVVAGGESDFIKPFKVVYEWTGRGFRGGAQGTLVFADAAAHAGTGGGRDEAVATLAFIFAPLVVGTAGGFIIGVADGIKTTAEEVVKVFVGKQEQVLTYTSYAYDGRGRLLLTRMHRADDSRQELARTEYEYLGDSPEPVKATITTYPDGSVRTIGPAASEGK